MSNLEHYGEPYSKILTTALKEKRTFIFKYFESASCLRKALYRYRYTLRDAAFAGDQSAQRQYKRFMKLSFYIKDTTLTIQVKPLTLVQEKNSVA